MQEYLKRLRVLAGINESAIKEAPITDFGTVGDFDEPDVSMRFPSDRKSVTHEPMIQKIKQKWERTPFNFNLYFVNKENYEMYLQHGLANNRVLEKHFPELIERISDDAINVIFTNNEGSNRIRLTPWMIAHRVSHALVIREENRKTYQNPAYMEAIYKMINIVKRFNFLWNILKLRYELPNISPDSAHHFRRFLFEHIGTMNSARKNFFNNPGDFFHEVFAQYLLTGKIVFNPLNIHFFEKLEELHMDYYNNPIENIENEIEVKQLNEYLIDLADRQLPEDFTKGLKFSVGKVYIV